MASLRFDIFCIVVHNPFTPCFSRIDHCIVSHDFGHLHRFAWPRHGIVALTSFASLCIITYCLASRLTIASLRMAIDLSQVTSLYVENLPCRWSPADIHLVLTKYGEDIDVFIPNKESKQGQRFAFVRFKNDGDISTVIKGVNQVQSETGYLHANVARVRVGKSPPVDRKVTQLPRRPTEQGSNAQKTYATAVTSSQQAGVEPSRSSIATVTYTPQQETLEWLSRSAFGILKYWVECHVLLKLFLASGIGGVSFSPVGVDTVLISFPSAMEMNAFCQSNYDWVKQWFSFFRPSQHGDGASDRTYWVRNSGIPLHAWSDDFFRHVVIHFGILVEVAPVTLRRAKLEATWVRVHTTIREQIHTTLNASILGKTYVITAMKSCPGACRSSPDGWPINQTPTPTAAPASQSPTRVQDESTPQGDHHSNPGVSGVQSIPILSNCSQLLTGPKMQKESQL
ncbi:hypothetical protein Tsubulata_000898 [Turnera subulata]|uniref:RRM domain-containing protein n=1 Tax=Turnera subulata TaxID=218843 RepID=A0A9Q0J0Z0_9ROSI|nr:hypothetical protein Tsubulata_000898 [Turnera subulata]